MSSKKTLKKFCKLSKYIEQLDKELFQVFDDLCLMHLLRPAQGSNGITFLYPKEKSYRQKIINSAYSNDPDVAANMLKSIVLQDNYPSPTSFGSNVVNLLNQKLDIKNASEKGVELATGLKLEIDKAFVPMGKYTNMSVYTLSGKGEIPLNGTVVSVVKKVAKTGGGFASVSAKDKLHKILEDGYVAEIGTESNIFVKKVFMQLNFLTQQKADSASVMKHLGNDEFSDSYLLDVLCVKSYPTAFATLVDGFQDTDKVAAITKDKYIELKRTFITGPKPESSSSNRLDNIQSPMDIRQRVIKLYDNDKERMGKDLFIVFCNVCRDLWNTDTDKVGAFKNFAFLASKVYSTPTDILNQGFDIARDFTLYGNLLKSDVFHFSPQASYTSNDVSLPIPSSMPSPLDMSLYSLSGFINKPPVKNVSGGGNHTAFLFEGL